jgi:lipoprotein-anchoring transpeptidase ErfK/SrfK
MSVKNNYLSVVTTTIGISLAVITTMPSISAQTTQNNNGSSTIASTQVPNKPVSSSAPNKVATKSNDINLVLKLGEKKVYVYRGDQVINKYPVAIGKPGWETPVGEWRVREMMKNPGWTNPWTGKQHNPGPGGPLGERWIGFWDDGKDVIGFHGTSAVSSIGRASSHGCVRMFNKDVKALYDMVKIGTVVKVVP